MNFDAFSHGQIKSKLWLLEHLEPLIEPDNVVEIFGSWYNILGFMMKVRRPDFPLNEIRGYDIDPEVKEVADKINNAFVYPFGSTINGTRDVNEHYSRANVVINCSPEHMTSDTWFENLHSDQLICIQSSDVTDPEYPWLVTQPNPTLEAFRQRYPLREVLFCDTLRIQYSESGYNRFMLIGRK